MNSDPLTRAERRTRNRRTNKQLTRVIYNAHAIGRVFGLARAQRLLMSTGFTLEAAFEILKDAKDRRRRAGREDSRAASGNLQVNPSHQAPQEHEWRFWPKPSA